MLDIKVLPKAGDAIVWMNVAENEGMSYFFQTHLFLIQIKEAEVLEQAIHEGLPPLQDTVKVCYHNIQLYTQLDVFHYKL